MSDFLGYIYKVSRWPGCGVGLAVVAVRLVGWWVGLRYDQRKGPNERNEINIYNNKV